MATFMSDKTNPAVYSILEDARMTGKRIRIWYGDTKTGRDWLQEFDTIGYVGRSTGEKKIFLLIKNNRSLGGGAILTDSIVKITIDKREVYKHPKYNMPTLKIMHGYNDDYPVDVCWIDGKVQASFKTWKQAENWIEFMEGKRNAK